MEKSPENRLRKETFTRFAFVSFSHFDRLLQYVSSFFQPDFSRPKSVSSLSNRDLISYLFQTDFRTFIKLFRLYPNKPIYGRFCKIRSRLFSKPIFNGFLVRFAFVSFKTDFRSFLSLSKPIFTGLGRFDSFPISRIPTQFLIGFGDNGVRLRFSVHFWKENNDKSSRALKSPL